MSNYDIAVLGSLYPKELENDIIQKSKASTIQFAASAHLSLILKGIEENINQSVAFFNLLPIGSYPNRYTDLLIPSFNFSRATGDNNINVGYCNLTIWKQFSKAYNLFMHLKKWAKADNGKAKIIISYSLDPEFLNTINKIKKICKVHVCQIVTDLPDYTDIDKNDKLIYKFATKYRVFNMETKIANVDSFVFLAEAMAQYFNTNKPYIVMEGLVNSNFTDIYEHKNDGLKYIVYTGSLTKKYGIMDLVNAFLKIDNKDYRLVICGSGEAEEEIKAVDDKRILFQGALSHKEAILWQKKATILVNPRNPKQDFTKYSFPSKIMEYMLSARPILCFKLPAFPSEYDQFLNYFKNDNINSMSEDIKSLCEMPDDKLSKMGKKAQQFVLNNKNEIVQCKRLLEMIGRECID